MLVRLGMVLVVLAAACGGSTGGTPSGDGAGAVQLQPQPVAPARTGPPRVDWNAGRAEAGEEGMLRLINEYRSAAGLAPVAIDPTLGKGCREHAAYMVLNRGKPQLYSINAHHQDPALPGASPDGAECGKSADLYPDVADLRDAVHGWMASVYHRQPIISPRIDRVGIGSAPLPAGERVAVALRFVYATAEDSRYPVAYPADQQLDVPIDFRNEAPTPIPPGGSATPGYPFTLQFPSHQPVTDVKATLVDSSGTAVASYVSSPEKPASQYNEQRGLVAIIPEQTLRAGERYTATVTAIWNGRKGSWTSTFSTIARRDVAANDEPGLLDAIGRPARVRGTVKRATKITEGTVMMDLEGPVGGTILKVAATVSLEKVAEATPITSKSRYLNELNGKLVEVDATPQIHFRTLRLDVPQASTFRVLR